MFEWFHGEYLGEPAFIKKLWSPMREEDFIREIAVLSKLHHPHLLAFSGACFDTGHQCMVMENVEITLTETLPSISLKDKFSMALQLARAVHYLHAKDIIHSALSTDAIMLTEDKKIKLTRFGFAHSQTETLKALDIKAKRDSGLRWIAPEKMTLSTKSGPTQAEDIYSVGLIVWSLFSNQIPYFGMPDSAIMQKKKVYEPLPISSVFPQDIATLMHNCCNKEPHLRPNSADLMSVLNKLQIVLERPIAKMEVTPLQDPSELAYEAGFKAESMSDFATAVKRYREAILQSGHTKAKTYLSVLLIKGKGVTANPTEAVRLLTEASTANPPHNRAMYNLGLCYHKGIGTPQNFSLAKEWYQKAVDNGFAEAQKNLASLTF